MFLMETPLQQKEKGLLGHQPGALLEIQPETLENCHLGALEKHHQEAELKSSPLCN